MRVLIAAIVTCVLPLCGQSIQPSDINGNWVLEVTRFGEPDYRRLSVEMKGSALTTKSGATELEGSVQGRSIEFAPKPEPQRKFTGTLENGVMTGSVTFGNDQGTWKATRAPEKTSGSKTRVFEPVQFHRQFSGSIPPALHIAPGDTVKTWSVDAGGVDAKGVRRSAGGNPLTGPFYVDGALPGDTLMVHFNKIQLNRDSAGSEIPL